MKSSVSGFTTAAFALAASLSLTVAGPHRAYAAPDTSIAPAEGQLSISVLSPAPRTSFSGTKPVEVAAFYQGTTGNPIVSVELLVDGQSAFTKKLDAPEDRGVISFLVDASQLSAGQHRVVVRAVAADAEIVSAKTSFLFVADQAAAAAPPATVDPGATPAQGSDDAPTLTFLSPAPDQKVTGLVRIEMKATDASGKQPYVSLFVDKQFKTLRNYAPYTYDLDTSTLSNGYHTVEVYAYNDEQNVGPAKVLRIYVNNPGGNTSIRTDLTDKAPAAHRPAAAAAISPALTDRTRPAATPVHRAVATKPIDRAPGASLLRPRTRKVAAATASPRSMKAFGPARRPSPRIALTQKTNPLDHLRTVLMAKRPDLLDQTGGLDLSSQLSDPFIPDTASPRPAAPARTPTTGFRPMPARPAQPSPAATAAATAPIAPKTVSVAHPAAQPAHVQAAAPAAQPAHVDAAAPLSMPWHVDAAPAVKPAHVQAAAPAAQPVHVQAAAPVAQPVHVQAAAPVAQPVHVQAAAPAAQPVHVQAAAPVAQPVHVQAAAPVIKTAHAQAVTPVAQPKQVQHIAPLAQPKHVEAAAPVAPVVAPKPLAAVRHIEVRHASAITLAKPAVHVMPVVRRPAPVTVSAVRPKQARLHIGQFSDILKSRGRMTVLFNNTILTMDRPMTSQSGLTFSALRQVFEFQGGTLDWDRKTNTVHAVSDTKDITLQIGSRHAVINHEAVILEGRPFLASGRTMVPLSFVAQALDANVSIDPATGHLLITSKH